MFCDNIGTILQASRPLLSIVVNIADYNNDMRIGHRGKGPNRGWGGEGYRAKCLWSPGPYQPGHFHWSPGRCPPGHFHPVMMGNGKAWVRPHTICKDWSQVVLDGCLKGTRRVTLFFPFHFKKCSILHTSYLSPISPIYRWRKNQSCGELSDFNTWQMWRISTCRGISDFPHNRCGEIWSFAKLGGNSNFSKWNEIYPVFLL